MEPKITNSRDLIYQVWIHLRFAVSNFVKGFWRCSHWLERKNMHSIQYENNRFIMAYIVQYLRSLPSNTTNWLLCLAWLLFESEDNLEKKGRVWCKVIHFLNRWKFFGSPLTSLNKLFEWRDEESVQKITRKKTLAVLSYQKPCSKTWPLTNVKSRNINHQ